MIRKERKARWVYRCSPCDYTSPASVDMFGAQEWQQWHGRAAALAHAFQGVGAAIELVVKSFLAAAEKQTQPDYMLVPPPPNIPHDPALRRDRRKWGGR